jgi:hypothetical protein
MFVLLSVAFAQSSPEPAPPKPIEIDFNELGVHATAEKPSFVLITETLHGDHKPLIVLRGDFNDLMRESADEVR